MRVLSPPLFKCPVLGTQLTFSVSWWQTNKTKQKNKEQASAVHTRPDLPMTGHGQRVEPCGIRAQHPRPLQCPETPGPEHLQLSRHLQRVSWKWGPQETQRVPHGNCPRAELQGCGWSPALSAPAPGWSSVFPVTFKDCSASPPWLWPRMSPSEASSRGGGVPKTQPTRLLPGTCVIHTSHSPHPSCPLFTTQSVSLSRTSPLWPPYVS